MGGTRAGHGSKCCSGVQWVGQETAMEASVAVVNCGWDKRRSWKQVLSGGLWVEQETVMETSVTVVYSGWDKRGSWKQVMEASYERGVA